MIKNLQGLVCPLICVAFFSESLRERSWESTAGLNLFTSSKGEGFCLAIYIVCIRTVLYLQREVGSEKQVSSSNLWDSLVLRVWIPSFTLVYNARKCCLVQCEMNFSFLNSEWWSCDCEPLKGKGKCCRPVFCCSLSSESCKGSSATVNFTCKTYLFLV